jgi:hypothetical protein
MHLFLLLLFEKGRKSKQEQTMPRDANRKCGTCRQPGHHSRQCPTKQQQHGATVAHIAPPPASHQSAAIALQQQARKRAKVQLDGGEGTTTPRDQVTMGPPVEPPPNRRKEYADKVCIACGGKGHGRQRCRLVAEATRLVHHEQLLASRGISVVVGQPPPPAPFTRVPRRILDYDNIVRWGRQGPEPTIRTDWRTRMHYARLGYHEHQETLINNKLAELIEAERAKENSRPAT